MNRDLVLYYEDVPTNDGRVLHNTVWSGEPIPLQIISTAPARVGHWPTEIIGAVTNVRRTLAGHPGITTVVGTASIDLAPYVGLSAEPDFDQAFISKEPTLDNLDHLDAPRLRAVVLGDRPCWKGMEIR